MKKRGLFSLLSKKMKFHSPVEEADDEHRIEEIFQELKDIKQKEARLARYVKGMERRKEDLEKYEALTQEDYGKVSSFLSQYKNVLDQRRLLEGRLIRNNPALRSIESKENEIPELIAEIKQTEKEQGYAHTDMLYLEQEKDYLYDYRESLITGYGVLKISAISFIIILGIICMILLTMIQTLRENIFVASSIISIIALVVGFGILIIKRQIEYQLELNELMQQKASRLLNKTKIRYFHHTNYLNFQYDSLGVASADQLKGQYERYLKNKNNEVYYRNMNNQLIEIEDKIFDILYDRGIERDDFDNIDEWAKVQNISTLMDNINQEYNNTTKQLEALRVYEEELSKEAYIITEANPELVPKVEALMASYINNNGGNQ